MSMALTPRGASSALQALSEIDAWVAEHKRVSDECSHSINIGGEQSNSRSWSKGTSSTVQPQLMGADRSTSIASSVQPQMMAPAPTISNRMFLAALDAQADTTARLKKLEEQFELMREALARSGSRAAAEDIGATFSSDCSDTLSSRVAVLERRMEELCEPEHDDHKKRPHQSTGVKSIGDDIAVECNPSSPISSPISSGRRMRKASSSSATFADVTHHSSDAKKHQESVRQSKLTGVTKAPPSTTKYVGAVDWSEESSAYGMKKALDLIESRRSDAQSHFTDVDKVDATRHIRGSIINKVHENKMSYLESSVWEVIVVVGVRGILPLESCVAVSLLILNVFLQALICIVLVSKFTRDDNQDAKAWRYEVGHWEKFASSVGRPMVSRMCVQDTSLELSGAQQFVFEDVSNWLKTFGGMPVGVSLVLWCLSIWFLFIWKEVQSTVDRIQSLCALPQTMGTKIYPIEDTFIMVSISRGRVYLALATCFLRICVAGTISIAGGLWLVHTESIEDLLLNAVALVFALEIDEVLFTTACPLTVKTLIESLDPMPCPLSGALHLPVRALGTWGANTLFVLGFAIFPLRQQWQKNEDLEKAFCAQAREFVTGLNPTTGMVFSYSAPGGSWPATTSLLSKVTESLVNGQSSADHLAMPTWTQFQEYVYMGLDDISKAFGSCKDHDPINDGYITAALADAVGMPNNNLTCNVLTSQECISDAAIVRLACPALCGCNEVRGPFIIYGCSLAHCTTTPQYLTELRDMRVEDIHWDVLRQMNMWNKYWDGYVAVMTTHSAQNSLRWYPPFVKKKFEQYGCEAIDYFINAPNVTKDQAVSFFCESTSNGFRRPLSIFCPQACMCSTRSSHNSAIGHVTPAAYYCPNPDAITLIACAGASVFGPVTVENTMCNQTLSNLTSPVGHYLCQPFGYNGKHSYNYTDSTGVLWKIRWETEANFDWAALYMGAKAGYAVVSKWTLSSQNVSIPQFSGLDKLAARFFATGNSQVDYPPETGWLPRNTSNTDVQCAGGQLTTKGGGEFGAGKRNSINCPKNYRSITNISVCENASRSIGYAWYKSYDDDTYPSGCYGFIPGRVYWNPAAKGSADPESFVICEVDPTLTTTTPNTTSTKQLQQSGPSPAPSPSPSPSPQSGGGSG